jgi:Protein of unknown function (DUF3667)
LNCGVVLSGRYCANCSQAADVHVPSTTELFHEALEGITHSDSRLWRTLYALLFKPGKLTQEFVAGRRAAYLPPFRLYLVVSVIFFLIASVSHPRGKFINFDDTTSKVGSTEATCAAENFTWLGRDLTPRAQHACIEMRRDNGANLLHVAIATAPKAMFIFLPLVAFLHMLLYWWPRHKYAEHLLFFLHLHAFFFTVMALIILSEDAAATWPAASRMTNLVPLLGWSLPVYTVLAMKRVFGRSWKGTLLKALALFVVYMLVFSLTVVAVFVYAMLQL